MRLLPCWAHRHGSLSSSALVWCLEPGPVSALPNRDLWLANAPCCASFYPGLGAGSHIPSPHPKGRCCVHAAPACTCPPHLGGGNGAHFNPSWCGLAPGGGHPAAASVPQAVWRLLESAPFLASPFLGAGRLQAGEVGAMQGRCPVPLHGTESPGTPPHPAGGREQWGWAQGSTPGQGDTGDFCTFECLTLFSAYVECSVRSRRPGVLYLIKFEKFAGFVEPGRGESPRGGAGPASSGMWGGGQHCLLPTGGWQSPLPHTHRGDLPACPAVGDPARARVRYPGHMRKTGCLHCTMDKCFLAPGQTMLSHSKDKPPVPIHCPISRWFWRPKWDKEAFSCSVPELGIKGKRLHPWDIIPHSPHDSFPRLPKEGHIRTPPQEYKSH